jgi:hypothetical protein
VTEFGRSAGGGGQPVSLLCSRNARPKKALARANGTSRRASGWAGEKDARSRRPNRPPSRRDGRASSEGWDKEQSGRPPARGTRTFGRMRRGAARPSFLLAEAARSECAPSMRAVKESLAAPLRASGENWKSFFGLKQSETKPRRPMGRAHSAYASCERDRGQRGLMSLNRLPSPASWANCCFITMTRVR